MSSPGRARSVLVLLGTFVLGGVFGGGLHAWLSPRPHGPGWSRQERGALPRWVRELNLSSEQREKAVAIFEKHRPELQRVFEESWPKARAINETLKTELREVLDEGQRAKLDAWEKAHPNWPSPPPPPP